MDKILIIGAGGQLGAELTLALAKVYGDEHVIATDIKNGDHTAAFARFEVLDVMDAERLAALVDENKITQIYHLAAILSATGEKNPKLAWKLNMDGLINVLDVAKEKQLDKIFWPSSIAVFGPTTPADLTPQHTIMDPNTIYGISKLAGERWCEYYFQKYNVDVRSLRYPGLIGYKSPPGGGTTDYAVDIFFKARTGDAYTCFLNKDSYLPMMYMPDAIRATIDLMEAEKSHIKVRSSYNVSAMSFSPEEIASAIQQIIPTFKITYEPDFRQAIADSWPNAIDDQEAKRDWGWRPQYNLDSMTADILHHLK